MIVKLFLNIQTHTIHYQIDGVLIEATILIADLSAALVWDITYQNQPICLLI